MQVADAALLELSSRSHRTADRNGSKLCASRRTDICANLRIEHAIEAEGVCELPHDNSVDSGRRSRIVPSGGANLADLATVKRIDGI